MKRIFPVTIVTALTVVAVILIYSVGGGGKTTQESAVVVGAGVWEAVEDEPTAKVLIGLRGGGSTTESRMKIAVDQQSRVLAELSESDFTLTHRFDISAALAGFITRAGIEKLIEHPDVVSIGLTCCGRVARSFSAGTGGGTQASESAQSLYPDVWEALETAPSVNVYIGIVATGQYDAKGRVLAALGSQDFELVHSIQGFGLSGQITKSGLIILAEHPDVRGVEIPGVGERGTSIQRR